MPEEFDGRPPKSPEQIAQLLKSIHAANNAASLGPYAGGLPSSERTQVVVEPLSPNADIPAADLLLQHGHSVGGPAGLLLGFNLGLALPMLSGQSWLGAIAPVALACCGWITGTWAARLTLIRRRRDLFPPAFCLPMSSSCGHEPPG